MCRRGLVNLCLELQLLRHWEQDAVDMRTLLQIASGWANACSETSLWAASDVFLMIANCQAIKREQSLRNDARYPDLAQVG